jgi:hypothetical protein
LDIIDTVNQLHSGSVEPEKALQNQIEQIPQERRLSLRQKEMKPVMDEFKSRLDTYYPTVILTLSLAPVVACSLDYWQDFTCETGCRRQWI